MRIVRFVLSLFWAFMLLFFVGCMKEDCCSHYTYFFFEKYFVPTKMRFEHEQDTAYSTVILHYDTAIEEMSNPEFRKLAAEYGEMGSKRILVMGPPNRKPYNVQGIKVWQGEGEGRVDVSAKVQLSYWDYSEYISSGYEYEKRRKLAGGYVSELTEHDLKWLTQGFTLNFGQLRKNELVLEITTKGGASFRKRLSDDF